MTFNANGIRSAVRKEFFPWFLEQDVDLLCIQETKAQSHQLDSQTFHLPGYSRLLLDAEKPGYSGVAIYIRHLPFETLKPLAGLWQSEGRLIGVRLPHLDVYSLYLPSGTSGDARQAIKYQLMAELNDWMLTLKRPTIIAGDWNIAHKNIDLKNWKSNQKNSGFLPEERAWLDQLLANTWVDGFRECIKEGEHYTWWTYRGQARTNNVGWRIDYHILNDALRHTVKAAKIHPNPIFSDHAPLSIWLDKDQVDKLETMPLN